MSIGQNLQIIEECYLSFPNICMHKGTPNSSCTITKSTCNFLPNKTSAWILLDDKNVKLSLNIWLSVTNHNKVIIKLVGLPTIIKWFTTVL